MHCTTSRIMKLLLAVSACLPFFSCKTVRRSTPTAAKMAPDTNEDQGVDIYYQAFQKGVAPDRKQLFLNDPMWWQCQVQSAKSRANAVREDIKVKFVEVGGGLFFGMKILDPRPSESGMPPPAPATNPMEPPAPTVQQAPIESLLVLADSKVGARGVAYTPYYVTSQGTTSEAKNIMAYHTTACIRAASPTANDVFIELGTLVHLSAANTGEPRPRLDVSPVDATTWSVQQTAAEMKLLETLPLNSGCFNDLTIKIVPQRVALHAVAHCWRGGNTP